MKILVIWNRDASSFVENLRTNYKKYSKSLKIEVANNEQKLLNLLKPPAPGKGQKNLEPFIPKRIFILVELDWEKQDFYGYSIFEKHILKINEFFNPNEDATQIVFISINKQKNIISQLKKVGDIKTFIASHYHHIEYPCVPDDLSKLPDNSVFHYEFLRQISFKNFNIISTIEHEIDKLRDNNLSPTWDEIKQEIKCLGSILSADLINKIENYSLQFVLNNKEVIKATIRKEYYKSLPSDKKEKSKLEYKVVVFEDDPDQVDFLTAILKNNFKNVEGIHVTRDKSFNDILNKLEKSDLAFIDLQFKDEDGFLPYSGFDIISRIQFDKDFNHIVFRLFSNMPRHMIGNIISIPVNHIIPKKLEDQTKRELIELEMNSIIEEVREKEKSKLYDYGSNIGPFNKFGLKTELFNEKKNDLEGFNEKYWKKAYHFASLFKEDNLTESTHGWTKELPSPKSIGSMKLIEFMDKHLPNILSQRLMVFYFLLNEKNNRSKQLSIELNHFSNRLQPFVNVDIIKNQKAYFNTRLGISCVSDSTGENDPFVEIKLKNLFPEEIDWLNKNLNKNTNRITIKENNGLFYNWLLKISNESVFPSGTWPSTIDEWSYIDFDSFISTLFESANQYKDLIEILYDAYTIFNPNEDSLPKSTIESVNKLCSFDPDDIG